MGAGRGLIGGLWQRPSWRPLAEAVLTASARGRQEAQSLRGEPLRVEAQLASQGLRGETAVLPDVSGGICDSASARRIASEA